VTIVVTGLGAVTALGKTARETFARLLEGERGFRELTLFDPGDVRTRLVAEVSDLEYSPDPLVSRTSELALMAARAAIADAGLDLRARRVGLVLGGTTAGMLETESVLATLHTAEEAVRAESPNPEREAALARMLSHPLSAPTDRIVLELGPFARARSLSSACSSGANALAVGATWLELGLVDAVVCGGADSLCRVTLSGFNALATLDPNGARPFDVRRRGLTLGEGAALVVLERAEDARARGKAPVCTLLGWSSRSEAHHITNPEASGEAPLRAMSAALARAGLRPSDVDYVNAHGTGTPLNDSMETRALARLFGPDVLRVPVSSQKGMIGHTLGAAGAIEAVITALAIEAGVLPPTGGLEEPDPECSLRHVMRAERRPIRAALSSSFGFGGMDTVLVLGAADRAAPPRPAPRSVVVTGIAAVTAAGVFAGEEVADVPERAGSSDGMVALPAGALDEERARRLDRVSRIAAVACGRALGGSSGERVGADARDAGIVLGIAFGAVDATAEFMRRLRDKGARMVRPAEFPSLVPSSPAGHVSIYLGLGGPALVVADLSASGECAIAQACELIAAGEMDRACAGGVEERSTIVEAVLAVTFGGEDASRRGFARGECGAVLALAGSDQGLPALTRLGDVHVWREGADGAERGSVPRLPPPPEGAIVVLGGVSARAEELVEATTWRACPRVVCAPTCGANEAAGGVAVAVAAAKVARGDAPAALFVGGARGWAYAGTLWPPEHAGGRAS
jgi:3-oxoacyl-[acyl-carrier-protein] synthase II